MYIQHSPQIWAAHPALAAAVVYSDGITAAGDATEPVRRFTAIGRQRLESGPESEFAEIQAWRRTFARMELRPTQYRCAAEALLRRLRKEGSLPSIHPLIDLCNAISVAFAIPVAALDVSRIGEWLEVRPAQGDEEYLTFGGEIEHPDPGEVIFADAENRAHARRWTNRQSGYSAVRESTTSVLIVAEALHPMAAVDVRALAAALVDGLTQIWSVTAASAILSADVPRYSLPA
jgi:DNA/RNA-binding domain of Phe-tRNA-synthetase-like protein